MSVRKLGSQTAEHDSGVVVGSVDRWTLRAEYHGRTLLLDVERTMTTYYLTCGKNGLNWEKDATPVSEADLATIREAVAEIVTFWGREAVIEF